MRPRSEPPPAEPPAGGGGGGGGVYDPPPGGGGGGGGGVYGVWLIQSPYSFLGWIAVILAAFAQRGESFFRNHDRNDRESERDRDDGHDRNDPDDGRGLDPEKAPEEVADDRARHEEHHARDVCQRGAHVAESAQRQADLQRIL